MFEPVWQNLTSGERAQERELQGLGFLEPTVTPSPFIAVIRVPHVVTDAEWTSLLSKEQPLGCPQQEGSQLC